jgi:hypothetical protein
MDTNLENPVTVTNRNEQPDMSGISLPLAQFITEILGQLQDLAFETIKESLKALELPEPVQEAIYQLASNANMLEICMTGGLNQTDDIGDLISRTLGNLAVLDKVCSERVGNINQEKINEQ